jgi:hypothetical protein
MTSEEAPKSRCAKCGHWQDDLDGFGVQLCESCGYCQHPSMSGKDGHWVCNLCNKVLEKLNVPAVSAATTSGAEIEKALADCVIAEEAWSKLNPELRGLALSEQIATLASRAKPLAEHCRNLVAENAKLRAAITKHHGQKADDRCFLDDTELYAAAGLPPADRRVGDKDAMLANCARFIQHRCESGGPWKSYAELEAERDKLQAFKDYVHARLDAAGVSADPESPHKAEGCRIGGRLDEVFAEIQRLRNECSATGRLLELIRLYKDDPATAREWCGNIGVPWVDDLVGERNRLREALTWAVGFIRCNFPKAHDQYEDMRNAESLADANLLHTGEFQRASARAELAEVERDRLCALLTQPLWLVWSNEHRAWWGPNRSQYYWDITAAGRYTIEEALKICAARGVERGDGINPPELIQPSPEWYAARPSPAVPRERAREDCPRGVRAGEAVGPAGLWVLIERRQVLRGDASCARQLGSDLC